MFTRHEYDAKKTLDSWLCVSLNEGVMMAAAQRDSPMPGVGIRSVRAQPGKRIINAALRPSADSGPIMGWGGDQ